MDEVSSLLHNIAEVCRHLFSSQELLDTLRKPGFMAAAFIAINLVVFTETGLLIGFFLPGDSLLVTAGIVSYLSGWNVPLLLVTLSIAAIAGDTVGYYIGRRTGPKIFTREKSRFFARDHLVKAQQFYERHGGKTIVLARFMPFIRTFAPVVAGVGQMNYRRFLLFNICGGIGWVLSMVLFGYCLPAFLENWLFRPVFGPAFRIQDHIDKVIVIVVLLSVSPIFIHWLRGRSKRNTKPPDPVAAAAIADPVAIHAGDL
ncbi:MAG TPA: VTT domain-containing protein [Gemmataceae bacterium]|jgi:membrane-associated protein|nr:VTT domain-containing protein [Gemmataceae bacterium]